MHKRYAWIFLLLLPLSLSAQNQNADWYQNKPIADITFSGIQHVDVGDLSGIINDYIGREFTDRRFLELQQRLYALDFFTQIIPNAVRADEEGNEVIIHFEVQERPIVDSVEFQGNRRLRDSRLSDAIVVSSGDIISRSRIRMDETEIRRLYRENGYTQASISSRIEDTDVPGKQRVIFVINEGSQTTIRQIQFVGNAFASDGALRGAMESKQQSLFNSGVFQEAVLEQDKRRILDYYRQRGYIDAEIIEIQTQVNDSDDNRDFLTITVYLEEGEQFSFEGMSFVGNSVFSDAELQALVRHRPNTVINLLRIEQDFERISDLYYSNGYIFNNISVEESRNNENLTVHYTVTIQEFNRAHIENIIVRGNTKTKDHVIFRELPFEKGDIFSSSQIRTGLFNLMNTGFFTAVVPETPYGSVEGLMDLIIDVEEGQTADIRLGVDIGGGGDFPVSGRIAWQDSNFRGLGQTIGAEVVASPVEQSLSFNFREPWLLGYRWSAGMNLTVKRTIQNNILQTDPLTGGILGQLPGQKDDQVPNDFRMQLQDWDFVLGGNTGYRFITPAGRLNLSTSLSTGINLTSYNDELYFPPYGGAYENLKSSNSSWELINRWRLGTNLDSRDILISPSSGYYLGQNITFTGGFLFGNRHFILSESAAEGYLTLFDIPVGENWNWKMVLKAKAGFSAILPQFWVRGTSGEEALQNVPDNQLLAVNGVTNARGWSFQPGLHGLWENILELRMPIAEQLLWFDTFFDATFPYAELSSVPNTSPQDGLYGIGAGLRFSIPQLPISLYFARLFTIDENNSIQWETGNFFNPENEAGKGLRFVLSFSSSFF